MKVFISWSGKRSEQIAIALKEWLPLILQYVDPWLSQSDIKAGERWSDKIAKELEVSKFGIVCITSDNKEAPWIMFEAGALAKSIADSRVIPLFFDLEFQDISGPLTQFQSKKTEEQGLKELILSLNEASDTPVPTERLTQLFIRLWPDFLERISKIPKNAPSAKSVRP